MGSESSNSDVFQAASMMLAFHKGLFIGEEHESSMAPDFLVTHMADFKAAGVTTIYMEMDHQRIAARTLDEECIDEYFGESKIETKANSNTREDRLIMAML